MKKGFNNSNDIAQSLFAYYTAGDENQTALKLWFEGQANLWIPSHYDIAAEHMAYKLNKPLEQINSDIIHRFSLLTSEWFAKAGA